MGLEIIIEDELLKTMIGSAMDEYGPLFNLQENALINRFGHGIRFAADSAELLRGSSLAFAGFYNSLRAKLNSKVPSKIPEDFKKAYSAYLSSRFAIQNLSGTDLILPKDVEPGTRQLPKTFFLEFGLRDYNVVSGVIENLTKYAAHSSRGKIKYDIISYFILVSRYARDKMNSHPGHVKNIFENIEIKAGNFKILGLSYAQEMSDTIKIGNTNIANVSLEKDPTQIILEKRVDRSEIIANLAALDAVEISVRNLLAYDRERRLNPYILDGGFRQLILLVGDTGTGKTLALKYAVSEAQKIAENNGLGFCPVTLEFEDSYQDGPVKVLRHQLTRITKHNNPYLVIVDEMEAKFSSRKSSKTAHYEEKTIREFLEFTNGVGYQNRGNYVVIGATNLPGNIDKAIRSRFSKGTYPCEGPKTEEEKAKVLFNNLSNGIREGYVRIKDWRAIGKLAYSLKLNGRQLAECSSELIDSSRTNHFPNNFYRMGFDEKLGIIKGHHESVDDQRLISKLYSMAEKQRMVICADEQFSAERGPA
jgi:AAA+ superfamily predicted ATPase